MKQVPRAAAVAAIDCERCKSFVEDRASDPIDVQTDGRVDAGTDAAYLIERYYPKGEARIYTCPDCKRRIEVLEGRNFYITAVPVDRAV